MQNERTQQLNKMAVAGVCLYFNAGNPVASSTGVFACDLSVYVFVCMCVNEWIWEYLTYTEQVIL